MRKFEQGNVVKLSKAGIKHVKKEWADEVKEDPQDFPFDGELGVITNVFGDDEPHTPGMVYVEWRNYADYLKPEHLLLGTEREFPAKVRAYEVRVGDVVKDEDGEEFTVRMIEEETEDGELYFWGLDSDGYGATRHVGPTKKIKVFKREYK